MARQEIRVGEQLKDGKGESFRTAFSKCNINFSEIVSFLSGGNADLLPTAIPISRGGTGASTIMGVRANLGLGDVATLSSGVEEGNVFLVGTCGVGTDLSPAVTSVDTKTASTYKSGEFGYFVVDGLSTVTLGTRDSNVKGQLGLANIDTVPELKIRGSEDTFSPWYEQYGYNNVAITNNGDLKFARNSIQIWRSSVVSQHGTEHSMSNTVVGTYSITNATLDNSQWSIVAPEGYIATATQAGTGINVLVTKDGVASNIVDNQYITVHLLK